MRSAQGFSQIILVSIIALILGATVMFVYQKYSVKPPTNPEQASEITNGTSSPTISTSPTETTTGTTFTSKDGKYSVKYPSNVKMYINEKMSADGVKTPVKDTTVFVSDEPPQLKTNYQLSIKHKVPSEGSLEDFVNNNSSCAQVRSEDAKAFTLGGQQASIFKNTPCGLSGVTVIYAVNNGVGYIIEIDTIASYADVSKYTDQILSTFTFTN